MPKRSTTTTNIEIIRANAINRIGWTPDDNQIWLSLKNKDISKNIQAYLWNAIHGTQRCGHFWLKIPEYDHRAYCHSCNAIETMDHILTECSNTGQDIIWKRVGELMRGKNLNWNPPNLGTLLGCGLKRRSRDFTSSVLDRFYTIVVSESMYLIWKLRCGSMR